MQPLRLAFARCSASHACMPAFAAAGAGDSAYEYFIKTWLLMGRDDAFLPYRHLFDAAADSLAARLTRRSGSRLYIAEQCVAAPLGQHALNA